MRIGTSPPCCLWLVSWLGFILIVGPAYAQEPRYEGRTFTQWQTDLQDLSPQVRRKAVEALIHFGPRAVPILSQALKDPAPDLRGDAATALARVGSAARTAAPTLSALVQDPHGFVRAAATQALVRIDPAAVVPALVQALKAPDAVVRREAAEGLGVIAHIARGEVPPPFPFAKLAVDPAMSGAVKAMAQGLKDAGPRLIAALKDPDRDVKLAAGNALQAITDLGVLKTLESTAIVELVRALGDRDVGGTVYRTLQGNGPAAIPALTQGLRVPTYAGRQAARLLAEIAGPAAVRPLLDTCQEATADVLNWHTGLEGVGPVFDGPAVTGAGAATNGVLGLATISPTPVPALFEALRHSSFGVRWCAFQSLASLGVDRPKHLKPLQYKKVIIAALEERLHDAEPRVRWGAALALTEIKNSEPYVHPPPAAPTLVEALVHGDLPTQREAARLLFNSLILVDPPKAVEVFGVVVPALTQALGHPDALIRLWSVRTLAIIGPAAKNAQPLVEKLAAGDGDDKVRESAVRALTRIKGK